MSNGIFTQKPASILEDVETFYFGGIPWIGSRTLSEDKTSIEVSMWDPEADEETFKIYTVTAEQITDAFVNGMKHLYLCCRGDIVTEQLGYGCATDLDAILQQACYGSIVFG